MTNLMGETIQHRRCTTNGLSLDHAQGANYAGICLELTGSKLIKVHTVVINCSKRNGENSWEGKASF